VLDAKGGVLSELEARLVFIQLVKAFGALHNQGIMQRDLKL